MEELANYKHSYKIGIFNNIVNSPKNYKMFDFVALYKNLVSDNIINYFKKEKINLIIWGFIFSNYDNYKKEYISYAIVDRNN